MTRNEKLLPWAPGALALIILFSTGLETKTMAKQIKLVMVGDGGCGKTTAFITYTSGSLPGGPSSFSPSDHC